VRFPYGFLRPDVDPGRWVEVVPLCPQRSAMSSILTPLSESSETKLCRSSRGVQARGSRPASLATRRKACRTLCRSSSVPVGVAKTNWSPAGACCRP